MKRVSKSKAGTTSALAFSRDDLTIMANALNHVCNGIALPEFTTLLGATKAEAEALLERLDRALKG